MTVEESSTEIGTISQGQAGVLANRARRAQERVQLRLSLAEARAGLRSRRGTGDTLNASMSMPAVSGPPMAGRGEGAPDGAASLEAGLMEESSDISSDEPKAETLEIASLVNQGGAPAAQADFAGEVVSPENFADDAATLGAPFHRAEAERSDVDTTSVFASLVGRTTVIEGDLPSQPGPACLAPAEPATECLCPGASDSLAPPEVSASSPPEPPQACASEAVGLSVVPDAAEAPALPKLVVGFGPGMLLRLRQLGYRTPNDLADADPDALRAALGEISRLLDVEAWIESARAARVAAAPV